MTGAKALGISRFKKGGEVGWQEHDGLRGRRD